MAITNPNDMAIDKNAFYAKYAQVAIEQQIKYGIPASITLAQMGFESTFGTSRLARESSNFFGVKQGGHGRGLSATMWMIMVIRKHSECIPG